MFRFMPLIIGVVVTLGCSSIQINDLAEAPRFEQTPAILNQADQEWFQLARQIFFVDGQGKRWAAPQGVRTDGASIPTIFVPIIGSKTNQSYLNAAVVHDAYCGRGNEEINLFQSEPWEEVHKMFYQAMVAGGTHPIKAKIMYAAVYLGGPRWQDPERDVSQVPEEDLIQELKWCIQLVEEQGATFEELEQWMRGRESNLISGDITKPDWVN